MINEKIKKTERSRKKKIDKIEDLIYHSDVETRINLFNFIATKIGPEHIREFFYEEGTGIRCLYSNISTLLLDEIIDHIGDKCEKYRLKL